MLLFNILGLRKVDHTNTGFNTSHVTVQRKDDRPNTRRITPFQYIPCYCSTKEKWGTVSIPISFNTSHVTVQHAAPCHSSYSVSVSIHPMLLFNHFLLSVLHNFSYVSIHPMLLFNWLYVECVMKISCFNTSHVTVQLFHIHHPFRSCKFQYIPCYCSTHFFSLHYIKILCFNTSHVTVQPRASFIISERKPFQYIPCYCSTSDSCTYPSTSTLFQYIPCYCSTQS